MDMFMLDWKSSSQIDSNWMMVARRVAILLCTQLEEDVADFSHEECDGRVSCGEEGTYVGVGGRFFTVEFAKHNGEPCLATFLIPRYALHKQFRGDENIIVQSFSPTTGKPIGYPDDVDPAIAHQGKLRITPRSR